MPYVEFHLIWTGMPAQAQTSRMRSRATDDYYWRYSGADGLLFSALAYPSALEICRYNFGRCLLDFAASGTEFRVSGAALEDFANFALNCQAIVSEGHLPDGDWLIPFQNNDSAVLHRDLWQRVEPQPQAPLRYNIGAYRYIGAGTADWIKIARDFIREQAAFAALAQQKLRQGLEVAIIRAEA